ncbi:MAG: DUF2807 domain-containing protein [Oceanicoccus sp.]
MKINPAAPIIATLLLGTIILVNVAFAEVVTKTVALDDVKKIRLFGDHEFYVTQGDDEFVKITATRTLLPKILAEIRGDTLILKSRNSGWNLFNFDSHARFDVQLKDIRSIHTSGSGYVEVDDLSTGDLSIKRSGSGDLLFAQITAEYVKIEVSGSGDINGSLLNARELDLRISGSGDIQLQQLLINETIDSNISGSATVTVDKLIANELEVSISGSGELTVNGKGRVKYQEIDITGSGGYFGAQVISETARLDIAGSGDADIHVIDKLAVDLTGSSDVIVRGKPTVDSNISGSGEIRLSPPH